MGRPRDKSLLSKAIEIACSFKIIYKLYFKSTCTTSDHDERNKSLSSRVYMDCQYLAVCCVSDP